MPVRYNSVGLTLTDTNSTYPYNIAKGNNALANVSVDASYNIAFGYNAGSNLINGNNNTFIGSNTNINSSSNTFSNSTAIGTGATIDASNQIMLGTSLQNVVVPGTLTGFGVTLPSFKVSIISNDINSVSPYSFVPIPYNIIDYDYNLGGVTGSNYNQFSFIYTVPLSGKYNFTYYYDRPNISGTTVGIYGSFIGINSTTTYPLTPSDPSGGQLYVCSNNYTTGTLYSQGSLSIRLNKNDTVCVFGYFKDFSGLTFSQTPNIDYYSSIDTRNTGGNIYYTDSNGLNPRTTYPYQNGYAIHIFTTVGTSSFVCNSPVSISYLVVAGGGGGGKNSSTAAGGGGGAGGYVDASYASVPLTQGTYTITVGAGGTTPSATSGPGGYGGDSSITGTGITVTAYGGGRGGGTGAINGGNGGSGGGAATNAGTAGTGFAGQGRNGAVGTTSISGGAGGGSRTNAIGTIKGNGTTNIITGTVYTYATGGGLNTDFVTTYGSGGAGQITSGTAGSGIKGIVVIRYPYSVPSIVNNWFTGEMVSY